MATAMYLEHYLDSLESLPTELKRNFTLMGDLDTRAQDLLTKIDEDAKDYMDQANEFSSDEKNQRIGDINKSFTKCKEYGDDKLSLAMQTYDMIDKHIRKLDADLARFEADLKEKAMNARGGSSSTDGETSNKKDKRKMTAAESKKQKKRKDLEDKEDPKASKKAKIAGAVPDSPSNVSLNALLPLSVAASDVLDMPVDPNEPTYCICHQVSYGEMIGCDNPECPIEWFHFGCVELTTKPKGKWFCPKCAPERKKK